MKRGFQLKNSPQSPSIDGILRGSLFQRPRLAAASSDANVPVKPFATVSPRPSKTAPAGRRTRRLDLTAE
jgi:hypothetical protein